MFKLVARIDNFDPRYYKEFMYINENGSGDDVKNWMLENCGVDHELLDDTFGDVVYQDPGYIMTYMDLMCETVSLYLI